MSALVPIAQTLGITSAAFLAGRSISVQKLERHGSVLTSLGMTACVSYIGIPTIALAPTDLLVRQWKRTYDVGKATAPPFAVTCAACFGFLAYSSRRLPSSGSIPISPFALYTAAAVAIPAIVPYTLLVMEPAVNRKLMRMAKTVEAGSKGTELDCSGAEVADLLRKWKGMNLVRAAAVATGAVLGVVASLIA